MADRVDPNVYGLQVALDFDATNAMQTLDDFGDRLTTFESNVAEAAQRAVASISDIVQSLGISLSGVVADNREITTSAEQFVRSFSQAVAHSLEMGEMDENRFKEMKKYMDLLTDREELENKLSELGEKEYDQLKANTRPNGEDHRRSGKERTKVTGKKDLFWNANSHKYLPCEKHGKESQKITGSLVKP